MARGQPDFGATAPTETVVGLSDLGELAARLGSVDVFDRRGNVIFLENFQGSLAKLQTQVSGTGASVSISNARARHGNFSCKLVTGNATDNYAGVYGYLAYPVLSKFGFEFSWCPQSWLRDMEIIVYVYDGSNYWDFEVRWHEDTDEWQYMDGDGNWQALSPTVLLAREIYTFIDTKLVIDLDTKEYVRLICNNVAWDLSGKAAWSDVSSYAPRVVFMITAYTRANNACTVYLGNLLVTQNEP